MSVPEDTNTHKIQKKRIHTHKIKKVHTYAYTQVDTYISLKACAHTPSLTRDEILKVECKQILLIITNNDWHFTIITESANDLLLMALLQNCANDKCNSGILNISNI